jgi:hypothetical protein
MLPLMGDICGMSVAGVPRIVRTGQLEAMSIFEHGALGVSGVSNGLCVGE